MKLGAFFVLGGTLALAGCSSNNAAGHSSTPTPGVVRVITPNIPPTPGDPQIVPTPAVPKPAKIAAPPGPPYAKGAAYLRARDYTSAEKQFERSIALRQHVMSSYDGLGTAAFANHDFAIAYSAYRAALKLQPSNPWFLYRAAYTALYARDFHGSVAYATHYIHMKPNNPAAYHLRLLAYSELSQPKPQERDARTIVRLQPHDPNAYNDLGIALGNQSKYGPAIQAFARAIELRPKNFSYYINRAIVENLDKQQQPALHDMEKAHSLATDPATRRQIGQAITNLKRSMQQH